MKIRSLLKWTIVSFLGTFTLLLLVLLIHIATATPKVYDNATFQLSRIDFKAPVDSLQAKEIQRHLKAIPGVKNDRLNPETGVLVYYHDNRLIDSENVYRQLMAKGNYQAQRYIISKTMAHKKVCPVSNTNSFSSKLSRGIQYFFH